MTISNEKLIELLKERVKAGGIIIELCQDKSKGVIEVENSQCSEKIGDLLSINLISKSTYAERERERERAKVKTEKGKS